MARGYVSLLAIVAAVWGSSYLFIKVAVEEVEPTAMMFMRLVLASAVLVPVLAWHVGGRAAVSQMRDLGWKAWAIGFLNAAFPFTLIAWGEKYVDSGVAAIANASVPIFVVILAFWFNPSERVHGVRLAGILVGLAGVAVLTGLHPEGGWWAIAGTLAIVVASLSYASANHFVQHNFSQTMPVLVTTASSVMGAVILLPFAAFQMPDRDAELEGHRVDRRPRRPRHGVRVAPLLPVADQLRGGTSFARHVPATAGRTRVRSAHPRREDHAERRSRPRADPRRGGARVGRGAPWAAPWS